MSLEATLEKIVGRQRKAESSAVERYEKLVRKITDENHEPAEKEVSVILLEGRKTADDLLRDVQARQHRIELRQLADTLPALTERERELRAAIAAADDKLTAAEIEHREIVQPLAYEVQTNREEQQSARNAAGALQTGYVGPLTARETEINTELATLVDRRAKLRKELAERQAATQIETQNAAHERSITHSTNIGPNIAAVERAEREAKRHATAAKGLQKELDSVSTHESELNTELAAVRKGMLQP